MNHKPIKVDMVYLMFAYQDESPDNAYYLDTEYGDVHLVNRELLDLKELTDEIETSQDKFLYIPKPRSEETIKDLRDFADSVSDAKLKKVLSVAFESPHVMQAFHTILSPDKEELAKFERFLGQRTKERVTVWLNANGYAPE